MFTFGREKFVDIYNEMLPLLRAHYHEIAWRKQQIPLNIDYDVYKNASEAGKLLIVAGRQGKHLIAYAAFFVSQHPHYAETKFAVNDVVFVHPNVRHQGAGTGLVRYCEQEFKALGVQVINWHIKPTLDWSPLLQAEGYERGDTIWQKWIGD